MVFNNVIRTASRVVPLAIRASTGTCYSHQHYSTAVFAAVSSRGGELSRNLLQRPFPSFLHHYSTKISFDDSLLGIIQSEIQSAVDYLMEDQAVEVLQGFPFKIEDHPEQMTVTLTREYQGLPRRVDHFLSLVVLLIPMGLRSTACQSRILKTWRIKSHMKDLTVRIWMRICRRLSTSIWRLEELSPAQSNFLHGYMVDKDTREYVTWLQKLQTYVQA